MIKYFNYDIVFREIPDKVSLAINITNCQNNCIGCHSSYLREDIGEELCNENFINILNENKGIDCVIFMGEGNDINRLHELAKIVKKNNILVALYSGSNTINSKFIEVFDYIKIGQYISELGGLNSKKTNQKLYKINNLTLEDITYMLQKNDCS